MTIKATATTGTTTATAIFPPADRPEVDEEFDPAVARAAPAVDDEDFELLVVRVAVSEGNNTGVWVDVTRIVCGADGEESVPSGCAGSTDVTTCTVGVGWGVGVATAEVAGSGVAVTSD